MSVAIEPPQAIDAMRKKKHHPILVQKTTKVYTKSGMFDG